MPVMARVMVMVASSPGLLRGRGKGEKRPGAGNKARVMVMLTACTDSRAYGAHVYQIKFIYQSCSHALIYHY